MKYLLVYRIFPSLSLIKFLTLQVLLDFLVNTTDSLPNLTKLPPV